MQRVCPICAGLAKQMRVLSGDDEEAEKARGIGDRPDPKKAPVAYKEWALKTRPDDGRRLALRAEIPTSPEGAVPAPAP